MPVRLSGITGSPGSCLARAYVFRRRIDITRTGIDESRLSAEIERLELSAELTKTYILASQKEALEKHGAKYAAIFDSHLLMLSDQQFIPSIIKRLKKEKVNVESLVRETLDQLVARFSLIEDQYLRERAIDLQDVGDRLLRNLLGIEGPAKEIGDEPFLLIADDVTPSELLEFARGALRGICLDSGGATSHVAILSGALGIPAIFGLSGLSKAAHTGDLIFVDTLQNGLVILHPDEETRAKAGIASGKVVVDENLGVEACTVDGVKPVIGANIARVEELGLLRKSGIRRVGLFRSEFLFMESVDPPSESFQENVYQQVVTAAGEMTVLRVLDIGSDKPVKYLPFPREANPAMGFRSIRFALARQDILLSQLRAMVKASTAGPVRIIFPMVSVASELDAISELWKKVIAESNIADGRPAGSAPAQPPEWGIMVEVPSVVFMMNQIARYTKYISFGTNDLLQFFFAVDRTNEKLAHMVNPLSLSFLRLLYYAVSAAKGEGIRVGICGEMAGDPVCFAALLGIGVDEYSMRLSSIPAVKKMVSRLNAREMTSFMHEILSSETEVDVREEMKKSFPSVFA